MILLSGERWFPNGHLASAAWISTHHHVPAVMREWRCLTGSQVDKMDRRYFRKILQPARADEVGGVDRRPV